MNNKLDDRILKILDSNKKHHDAKRNSEIDCRIKIDPVAIHCNQFFTGKKLASECLGPYEAQKHYDGRYDVRKVTAVEGSSQTPTSFDHIKMWSYEMVMEIKKDAWSSGTDEK